MDGKLADDAINSQIALNESLPPSVSLAKVSINSIQSVGINLIKLIFSFPLGVCPITHSSGSRTSSTINVYLENVIKFVMSTGNWVILHYIFLIGKTFTFSSFLICVSDLIEESIN